MEEIEKLIEKIKQKKELSGIEYSIISNIALKYLKKEKIPLSEMKEKQKKTIIKKARAELRLLVGRFRSKDRAGFLEKKDWQALLATHSSAKERLEAEAYKIIKKIISDCNVFSILDLGCGINPLAIACKEIKYTAIDINKEELEIVKQFFKEKGIHGKTIVQDIRHSTDFPSADLCLILKVFDVIETKGHKLAEKIIKSLKCKHLLISFSTKTLSGKSMNHPQRGWIEQLLNRIGYPYKSFKTKNEIFYLAEPKA